VTAFPFNNYLIFYTLPHIPLSYQYMKSSFIKRHTGLSAQDELEMLQCLGFKTLDELTSSIIPKDIQLTKELDLPSALGEKEALAYLKQMLSANAPVKSLIGQGYYGTSMPSVIQRNILENPSWYTAYTPYQPEIAQGRLEMLVNFQSMISGLTGLAIANASMLDEGTAAAEAMMLCKRVKSKSNAFFIDENCFPQTIDVVRTRCETTGIRLIVGDWKSFDPAAEAGLSGVLVSYPNNLGSIDDYKEFFATCHSAKILCIVIADLLALTVLKDPASFGADVCLGSTQRFGIPMGYGGPAAGYMACTDALKRKLPGRIIGLSITADGKPAYRLALQTREQHIRREHATSNICTAQVLMAILATFYAMYQGPEGLRDEAMSSHRKAQVFAKAAKAAGYKLGCEQFFDTVLLETPAKADELVAAALVAGFNIRRVNADSISVSFDATLSCGEFKAFLASLSLKPGSCCCKSAAPQWDSSMNRETPFCAETCFSKFHTETEMMRFMHHLESKDLALNEAMIPLGSCTMKANCASIMMPLTWPEVSELHPMAPENQCKGMRAMLKELEERLAVITGFAATSLQPNSGAAGEYAGLLTIHRYQVSQGQGYRNICLIPNSAHGTNPASAAIAGWKVVPVKCDAKGNIDPVDFKAQAEKHRDNLAAAMITYPSTHGVYEDGVKQLCEIVHANGGQVYMDGANMNGQSALTNPGFIGADVCHLNLHKSFAMPHGGGGPGVGSISCAAHLVPFLPGHQSQGAAQKNSAVSSTEFGSASLCVITWMFLAMLGHKGLKKCTQLSILSANYVAKKLEDCFPVLYCDDNGLVAHECILNTKPMLAESHLSITDMAKRLMDYGFHAPTMSFPVPNTFMVEPTESESKVELDRFITAMRMIHAEMTAVTKGEVPLDDNVLVNAPHTAQAVCADEWNHAYTRSEAAYPVASLRLHKFWPSCGRIDDTYGDRNFCCTCDTLSIAENA